MKRLVALLVLLISPALYGQVVYTDPTQIPTVEQTYTVTQQQIPTPLEEIKNTSGTPLTLYDDGVSQPVSLNFDFYYFGNLYNSVYISQNGFISFTNNANGCCSGNPLPYFTEWTEQNTAYYQYYSVNNSIFAMWSDLADFNVPGNPYYKSTGNSFVVGWYGIDELGSGAYSCNEFGCTQGPGNKFTFEISLFSDSSFSINYGAFDYNNQTGRTFTSGYQGDQEGEYYQIYYGTNPSSLQNTTYFVQSSEIIVVPDAPIAVDCTLNPADPTCIINDLITDEEQVYLADEETGSDDGSSDGSEIIEEEIDETLVADETEENTDETVDETLDEIVDEDEEIVLVENNAVYRELTDEEKAALLADAISKSVIEGALTIANDATQTKENTAVSTTTDSSTRSTMISSSDTTLADNKTEDKQTEEKQTDTSNNEALDILETGRSIGQTQLASTLEQTKESAEDSVNQAENIAVASNDSSNNSGSNVTGSVDTEDTILANISIGNVIEEATMDNTIEQNNNDNTEILVADTISTETQNDTTDNMSFADIMNIDIKSVTEQKDEDIEFVNQILAETNKQQEQNNSGFNEDEQVTIQNDPTLANAFNVVPNTTNLELAGVIGKQEDKSDAEKRAEEIVAANKEQQDEINKNYMDADQSGLIGAIAGDTDVTAYRTANLPDLSSWYKPEDIYKNVKYNDNVRGMYFLEKGNTDTYKKMVEEQYK